MNRRIYLDNAATSFPKPPAVLQAVTHYATQLGASPGRGAYHESRESAQLVAACRQHINRLIHGQSPDHVIFTLNCSDALNMAIRGTLRPGDHVITTDIDHNSILRPLNRLTTDGLISATRIPADRATGLVDPELIRKAINPRTRLIALLHASNVIGSVQDIAAVGSIARQHNVLLLVDSAQSIGHIPIDVQAMHIDLLAAPGHKGLLGPSGTGFLYIRPGLESQMTTSREGGTGSRSESDTQPTFMPDRFEAGSHNTLGIVGLSQGIQWILQQGVESLHQHSRQLCRTFLDTIDQADAPGLTVFGPRNLDHRTGVFSIRIDSIDRPQDLSDLLERDHGLLTRSGLHCAPGAHATLGTLARGGTTRMSFGPFTTPEDVRQAADALITIAHSHAPAFSKPTVS
jgi:cysteine desulfurase family protein